jgi:predicted esterase
MGRGELVLTIRQGTNTFAETSAWFDLRDVENMYEWASAENVTSGIPPSDLVSRLRTNYVTLREPDETGQIIVFVHGINNTESQCRLSTATTLKRLYWSGYRGKVAGFRWPCGYFPPNGTINPYQFNRSEFYAFKAATAFTNYLNFLATRADLPSYTINILAHSQGAAIVSEALNQGAAFDTLILSQAAMPAHSYDGIAPTLQKLLNAETNEATPYFPAHGGYHECYNNISGHVVNFFNTNDYALATGTIGPYDTNWEKNQETEKPESFVGAQTYHFQPPATSWRLYPGPDEIVYDMLEARSMVARSRSRAVGAQGGLGGVIDSSVNLSTSFGFGATREDHSGQFARPIQTVLGYYLALRQNIE